MREAILVTGLKTQRVRCGKEVEYQIYDPLFDMLNPAHREFLRLTEKNLKLGMGYDEAWQTAHRHITRNKNG